MLGLVLLLLPGQSSAHPPHTTVEFPCENEMTCRGLMFQPEGFRESLRERFPCEDTDDEDPKWPMVILAHGCGAVVEAGLIPYAERFAEAGMYVLAFDYRYFGMSDGEPRELLSMEMELADWAAALAYARSMDEVDNERIAIWGSSMAGGPVIEVAARDEGEIAAIVAHVPMASGMM